jgi:pyruvate-ferredoxin/flavodoxin oxidoreductase
VIREAESYRGTSLLICFSHCISWGINMTTGMQLQKDAVNCGYWPLYHFDPRDEAHPFHLDSRKPTGDYKEFAMKEARFNILTRSKPEAAARLAKLAQDDINVRWHLYEQLAGVDYSTNNGGDRAAAATQTAQEVKA